MFLADLVEIAIIIMKWRSKGGLNRMISSFSIGLLLAFLGLLFCHRAYQDSKGEWEIYN
jgi:hypothetical protein